MTMTSHFGSAKLCVNINCRNPIQATRPSWNCPNGCFLIRCVRCSFCDSCEKPKRSTLPLNRANPAASFRMPNFEGTSFISTSSITVVGPMDVRTPCLLNSSNTEPVVDVSDRPTPASRLGKRKNSIAKPSSQIRASQMIKGKTVVGIEQSRSRNLFGKVPHLSSFSSDRHSNPLSRVPLATPMAAKNQMTNGSFINNPFSRVPPATPVTMAKNQIASEEKVSKMRSTPPAASFLNGKNGSKLFTAVKADKSRFETGGKDQILPRYMPKITDEELKQIPRGSNTKVTPLFEKKLTASDAGRIGRLVLPKKCAEIYFPKAIEPLGAPLTIQDSKGKDWELNFRYWPNNNSRMYVLEGFIPLLKSMDLKEGDTVTFIRLEPEGKLVMGYRKAKTASASNQAMVIVSPHNDVSKGNTSSPTSIESQVVRAKRKSSNMGSTSKIIEPEKEMIALDLTTKEAQELVRPHPGSLVPDPTVIDEVEIKSFEDDPVIGRPTIFDIRDGIPIQWGQCEACCKWRKIPSDVVIPAKWTCSLNHWDPQRSRCSAREEMMSNAKIKECFSKPNEESSKKMKIENEQPEPPETVVARDELAVIPDENVPPALPSPAKATSKHPRHRPGCGCIVCSQPPSGTKHSSTCTCSGCKTVRRRHQTVNSRRGKKPVGPTRRKRTRRTENTRKSALVGVSNINKKKPRLQPDSIMKQVELSGPSSSQLMKPAQQSASIVKPSQQPASILKPPMVRNLIPILQMEKSTENHQTPKSVPAKTEPRLFDLNLLPEPDDEDSMQ